MAQLPPTPAGAQVGPQPTTVVPHYEHPPGYIPADHGRTNTMAIVSLAAGVLSFLVLPVIGAVVAIVAGRYAREEIRRTGQEGAGLALIGIILGCLHLVLVVVGLFVGMLVWLGLITLWFLV